MDVPVERQTRGARAEILKFLCQRSKRTGSADRLVRQTERFGPLHDANTGVRRWVSQPGRMPFGAMHITGQIGLGEVLRISSCIGQAINDAAIVHKLYRYAKHTTVCSDTLQHMVQDQTADALPIEFAE